MNEKHVHYRTLLKTIHQEPAARWLRGSLGMLRLIKLRHNCSLSVRQGFLCRSFWWKGNTWKQIMSWTPFYLITGYAYDPTLSHHHMSSNSSNNLNCQNLLSRSAWKAAGFGRVDWGKSALRMISIPVSITGNAQTNTQPQHLTVDHQLLMITLVHYEGGSMINNYYCPWLCSTTHDDWFLFLRHGHSLTFIKHHQL